MYAVDVYAARESSSGDMCARECDSAPPLVSQSGAPSSIRKSPARDVAFYGYALIIACLYLRLPMQCRRAMGVLGPMQSVPWPLLMLLGACCWGLFSPCFAHRC